jgi:hypothetical protein
MVIQSDSINSINHTGGNMPKNIYTIEAKEPSGAWSTRTATSYREARAIASGLRRGFKNMIRIIKGHYIEFDAMGFPTNILDTWKRDGRKWYRSEH